MSELINIKQDNKEEIIKRPIANRHIVVTPETHAELKARMAQLGFKTFEQLIRSFLA